MKKLGNYYRKDNEMFILSSAKAGEKHFIFYTISMLSASSKACRIYLKYRSKQSILKSLLKRILADESAAALQGNILYERVRYTKVGGKMYKAKNHEVYEF